VSGLSADQVWIIFIIFLVLVGVALLVDVALFVAWAIRKDAVDAGLAPPLFARSWSLVDVWIAGQVIVGLLIACMILVGVLMAVVGAGPGKHGHGGAASATLPLGFMLAALMVQNVLLVAVPAGFIMLKYATPLRRIGLTLRPRARDCVIGLTAGVVMLVLANGLEIGLNWIMHHFLPSATSHSLAEWSKGLSAEQMVPEASRSLALYALLLFSGAVAAPIGEEFFFRGFLYNAAKRRTGLFWGTVISAAVFALAHGGPIQVLAIFPMGVLLAVMYEITGSLWVPIFMHAVNNGAGFLIAYFATRGG
jgi:membrane protease YdiL (CAAX protease family)